MNENIKIINTGEKAIAINITQIRMIDVITRSTSRITWIDGSTENIGIPFKNLIKALYDQEIEDDKNDPLNLPIEELWMSVGSYNALKGAGINTVADITKHTYAEIASIKRCGKKRTDEIQWLIEDLGLKLKED
jgi:DNA-directed RNA polymerase alpha subunit